MPERQLPGDGVQLHVLRPAGDGLTRERSSLVADGSSLVADGSYVVADGSYVVADGSSLVADGSSLVADGSDLLWAPLADELDDPHALEQADAALFQRSSGKTHFLTPLGALVLHELTLGPRDLGGLVEAAQAASDEPRDALQQNIHELLVEFAARGLVRPATP